MSFLGGLGVGSFPHGKDLPPERRSWGVGPKENSPPGGCPPWGTWKRPPPRKVPLGRWPQRIVPREDAPVGHMEKTSPQEAGRCPAPTKDRRAGRVWNPPLQRPSGRRARWRVNSERSGELRRGGSADPEHHCEGPPARAKPLLGQRAGRVWNPPLRRAGRKVLDIIVGAAISRPGVA